MLSTSSSGFEGKSSTRSTITCTRVRDSFVRGSSRAPNLLTSSCKNHNMDVRASLEDVFSVLMAFRSIAKAVSPIWIFDLALSFEGVSMQ